jgi:hypothetical protein
MAYRLRTEDPASSIFHLQGIYTWSRQRCCYVRAIDIVELQTESLNKDAYLSLFLSNDDKAAPKLEEQKEQEVPRLALLDKDNERQKGIDWEATFSPDPHTTSRRKPLYVKYRSTEPSVVKRWLRPEVALYMSEDGHATFVLGADVFRFSGPELDGTLDRLERPTTAAGLFTSHISRCVGGEIDWAHCVWLRPLWLIPNRIVLCRRLGPSDASLLPHRPYRK